MLILDLSACVFYCRKINSFFNQNEVQNSDVAVVFFGNVNRKSKLGLETVKRLDCAAKLLDSGRTKYIICVGGKGLEKKLGITGSQMMRDYLVAIGIPEEKVAADTSSYDSYSNWKEARRIIHAHNWETVTLVSSAFHLYRLSTVVKDENLSVSYSPYSVDCADSLMDLYTMREWIHHEWKAFAAQNFFPETLYRGLLSVIRR
jgi:uncharacterized SAM-binding protein YcdF (DUF218 family)